MHKLERGKAPHCLKKFKHGLNTWDDVSNADKVEIWVALETIQGHRCAYCESDISGRNKQIEHFRQKASHRYPQGTFEWANLFGSCTRKDSCGNHKDKCGEYHHEDLIKPDEEDPELYLLFVVDGSISQRHGLTEKDNHRAKKTLEVFNLDYANGPLRQMRKNAISGYLQTIEELQELSSICSQIEYLAFLKEELVRIEPLPFATAIKHAITSQLGSDMSE